MLAEEKAGFDIVPVFITVDPERDNVEQVREYVKGASIHIWITILIYSHVPLVI
jgi:cytochrome oxidase Cu insertion factor (SCO1/SenC/PrrC family)